MNGHRVCSRGLLWALGWGVLGGLLGCLGAVPARADIAPDPEFGTTLAPWGPCGVRMVDEHVTLRLAPDHVEVLARFTLKNGPEAARLRVGFPESVRPASWSSDEASPPQGGISRLDDFRATVDGVVQEARPRYFQQEVGPFARSDLADQFRRREAALERASDPAEKARLKAELDAGREQYGWWSSSGWMVWQMEFAPGQVRKVEVAYRSPWLRSGDELREARNFRYILTSGAYWDGTIGEAVVEVVPVEGLTMKEVARLAPEGAVRTETGARWTWKDLEPDFDIGIDVLHPDLASASKAHRAAARAVPATTPPAERKAAAGWRWCMAYRCDVELHAWPAAAEACREILALQRAVAGGDGPRERVDCFGWRPWDRPPASPWEVRLVDALLASADEAGARAAAADAASTLVRWLARGEDELEAAQRPALQEALARMQRVQAGGR